MDEATQNFKDPLQVHRENMKMLSVLPPSGNRSMPNSPMLRRAAERSGRDPSDISPSPRRKDFLQVTEGSRSTSWTKLNVDNNSPKSSPRHSPKQSPIGSPSLSVSDKLIRTHYLSNTTGKAGSYMLKKSEEIIKHKSPLGSPRFPRSPNVTRKTITTAATTGASHPQSADTLQKGGKISDTASDQIKHPKTDHSDDYDSDSDNEIDQHIKDVRESIGFALSQAKLTDDIHKNPTVTESPKEQPKDDINAGDKTQIAERKEKPRRHKYVVYGDTGMSPGYLTPPREPRGSVDLRGEMETWKRKERKTFDGLGMVDGDSDDDFDDDDSNEEIEKPEAPLGVFMMPPVSRNVSHQPESRDFSIPAENQADFDPEQWEEMKRCRYLRIHGEADSDNEDEGGEEEENEESDESNASDDEN